MVRLSVDNVAGTYKYKDHPSFKKYFYLASIGTELVLLSSVSTQSIHNQCTISAMLLMFVVMGQVSPRLLWRSRCGSMI